MYVGIIFKIEHTQRLTVTSSFGWDDFIDKQQI